MVFLLLCGNVRIYINLCNIDMLTDDRQRRQVRRVNSLCRDPELLASFHFGEDSVSK